jgi:hypothetical protein
MRWSPSSRRAALLGAASCALGACLVVPTPEKGYGPLGRDDVAGRVGQRVVIGEPLDALLLRLGEPDATSLDGCRLAWGWRVHWGWLFAVVPVGAGPAPAPAMLPILAPLERERALVVRLDERNRVASAEAVDLRGRAESLVLPFEASEALRFAGLALFEPEPTSWRGEPLLFAGRALWTRWSGEPPEEVLLIVDARGVHLKAPGSFGPAPAELSLRYAEMSRVEFDRGPLGIGADLAIEMRGGAVHHLFVGRGRDAPDAEATERVYELVRGLRGPQPGSRGVAP